MLMELQRDSRHLNHMSNDTKVIHARLEQWAKWAKDFERMGWPESIFGAIARYGADGASQHGKPPVSMPEEIAVMDAAVAKLGEVDRRVIRRYYLQWAPAECLWKDCEGIRSLSNFRAVLKRARWRLSGFVDGLTFRT
jgi:hypothetical protein